jgi:hypothetical protein
MLSIKFFKRISLVALMATCLAGCGGAQDFLVPKTGPEKFMEIEQELKPPPGNDQPGAVQAIASDPLPTAVLPDSEIDLGDGTTSQPLKPVKFNNLGTVAYTVSPSTYKPASSSVPAIAPLVSTVATPGGSNSSSYLSLPMGSYTWCYWWELGDINGDGMMDYAHSFDNRPVVLDENDSDELEFAEVVDLAAPGNPASYGQCGLEIAPFVVGQQHADNIIGPLVNMGHDTDSVTLKGPITVAYYYIHAEQEIHPGVPRTMTKPEVVVIPAGETHTFELVDGRGDHPGDWNMYIWLLSIDQP